MSDEEYQPKVGDSVRAHQSGKDFIIKRIGDNWITLESEDGLQSAAVSIYSFRDVFFKKEETVPPKR